MLLILFLIIFVLFMICELRIFRDKDICPPSTKAFPWLTVQTLPTLSAVVLQVSERTAASVMLRKYQVHVSGFSPTGATHGFAETPWRQC